MYCFTILNIYFSRFAVNDNDVSLAHIQPSFDLFTDFQEEFEWRWCMIGNSKKPDAIFKYFWRVRSFRFFQAPENIENPSIYHYNNLNAVNYKAYITG